MVKMNRIRFGISLVILLCSTLVSGQVTNDFGVWLSGSFSKDITKDFDFSIEQEFRLDENATELGKAYTTLSLDYKLQSWIRFGLNYRFILNKGDDALYGQRHRVMGDMSFRMQQHRWKFTNRIRAQSEIRTVNYTHEFGFAPTLDLRNTIKVKYRINRKYEPHMSADFRFLMRDVRTPYITGFDRHRIVAGVDITLARNKVLDLYVLTSRHWNIVEPKQLFVVGASFSFGSEGALLGH